MNEALERAFNILGHRESRGCYDALLPDGEPPAIFPYGRFGSVLVAGESSRDGQTKFARRILAFSPGLRHQESIFHCEDVSSMTTVRRVAMHAVPTIWDRTWNQWKHCLGAKIEVEGVFVQSGRYRKRRGERELTTSETALPSRLQVKLPADFQQQLKMARETYHRFGGYLRALDQIRLCLEHRAIEKSEMDRMCSQLGIPGDFDIAHISLRPDYDQFFYRQLLRWARRIYLFRNEYIFDLEKAPVVETPQRGHATYVFAKPRSMDSFLTLYTGATKDDIRANRDNIGERLGFLGRVMHSTNPDLGSKRCGSTREKRLTSPCRLPIELRTLRPSVRQTVIGKISCKAAFQGAKGVARPHQKLAAKVLGPRKVLPTHLR